MAEEENRSGLLSKVAKFVRHPTKDWSELDPKDTGAEGGYSKEALKDMMERKRQNDFVRKREFEYLRKLRRTEPLTGADQARPSFFHGSVPSSVDDRAETLKKIDEIEAQMSRQWWKGRDVAPHTGSFPVSPRPRPEAGPTPPPAVDEAETSSSQKYGAFEPTVASDSRYGNSQNGDGPVASGYIPTPLAGRAPTPPASLAQRARAMGAGARAPSAHPSFNPPVAPPAAPRVPMGAGFSTQRLYAAVPADGLTDPDLEDAAIRYANGDDDGAEESLLAALQREPPRPELVDTWMAALFDLYRATGQQARFDSVALEFANRFGRSAPAWFSTPELLSRSAKSSAVAASSARAQPSPASNGVPDWTSPAQLDAAALEELHALMRVPGRLVLNWEPLVVVGLDAVPVLARLVAQWCVTSAQLVLHGHASLERALLALTPSGDRTVSPLCWQLRMDALRGMRLQDAFELVALDYCVTYEVSPPSWQEPRCRCELGGVVDAAAAEAEDIRSGWDNPHSTWDDPLKYLTASADLDEPPPAVVELYGEIIGDAAEVLAKLAKGMEGASRMVVSCARLIRVDFSAAGSVLNWVAEQQSRGCQVQFRDVNRMVAAFFNVIGISEHARVVPRAG